MKKKSVVTFLYIMSFTSSFAQFNFESADGEGMIFTSDSTSGLILGYEFGSSNAAFQYSFEVEESRKDTQGRPALGQYSFHNIRFRLGIKEQVSSVISDGSLQPNIDLVYDYIWDNSGNDKIYKNFRAIVKLDRNKFVKVDEIDSIQVDTKLTQKYGLGLGFLLNPDSDKEKKLLISLFPTFYFIKNPISSAEKRDVFTSVVNGINGSIQKVVEAYLSAEKSYFQFQPRVDIAWSPFLIEENGEEIGPRIGFLSSFSSNINLGEFTQYNFSIGPAIFERYHTNRVISALLVDFIDFTDARNTKGFDDIFSIKFYVGLPIAFR